MEGAWFWKAPIQLFVKLEELLRLHEHGLRATVRLIAYTDLSVSCCACCQRIQLESPSLPVFFSPTLQSGSSPSHSMAELKYTCNVDTQSSRNISMRSFEIYSKWSVQANKQASKQANIHTHVPNAVTLVWGSLRLASIISQNKSLSA